ncbi:MAG TPA: hypothetical protein VGB55_02735 [Tepidisphaeraceae bacterium]
MFTRPELLPYTIHLSTLYIVVVAVLSTWCWRSIQKMDAERAKEYQRRLSERQEKLAAGENAG